VGLKGDSLNLVSTIEELLGRNSSGSGLENRETTLHEYKLCSKSPTREQNFISVYRVYSASTGNILMRIREIAVYLLQRGGGDVRLTICPCYSTKMALNVDLDIMQDLKGIRERA
jgi:hypothetical protein